MNPDKIKAADTSELDALAAQLNRAEMGSRTGSVKRRRTLRAIRKELFQRKQKPAQP